jgi:hypothetical protein
MNTKEEQELQDTTTDGSKENTGDLGDGKETQMNTKEEEQEPQDTTTDGSKENTGDLGDGKETQIKFNGIPVKPWGEIEWGNLVT